MAIKRRTPEVNSTIAHRLRQIDAFGQPQGAEAMEEARHYAYYGWVDPNEWSLTPLGEKVMNDYYAGVSQDKARLAGQTHRQPNARDVYDAERKALAAVCNPRS